MATFNVLCKTATAVVGAGATILVLRQLLPGSLLKIILGEPVTSDALRTSTPVTSGEAHALDCRDSALRLEAARVCADAFAEDEMFAYFLPTAVKNRKTRFTRIFELFLWSIGSSFEMVDVVRDDSGSITSLALWEPHEATPVAMARVVRMLSGFVWQCGTTKGLEAAKFFLELETRRAKLAPKPHFHLQLLATDPAKQKKGFGTAAIKAQLARNDAAKVASYLESSKAENLAFYQKLGFVVVDEVVLPNGHPVHLMLREPPQGGV